MSRFGQTRPHVVQHKHVNCGLVSGTWAAHSGAGSARLRKRDVVYKQRYLADVSHTQHQRRSKAIQEPVPTLVDTNPILVEICAACNRTRPNSGRNLPTNDRDTHNVGQERPLPPRLRRGPSERKRAMRVKGANTSSRSLRWGGGTPTLRTSSGARRVRVCTQAASPVVCRGCAIAL